MLALAAVFLTAVLAVLYWRYRKAAAELAALRQRCEKAAAELAAVQKMIRAYVEDRDAARRHAAQEVKRAEEARLALEARGRECAAAVARLEEELDRCVKALDGRYHGLQPERPLPLARAVEGHYGAVLPPLDVRRIFVEVPVISLSTEARVRSRVMRLAVERYGVARPIPLPELQKTVVYVHTGRGVERLATRFRPPAVYVDDYGILTWSPAPPLRSIMRNLERYRGPT